jgi:hypothetical protein
MMRCQGEGSSRPWRSGHHLTRSIILARLGHVTRARMTQIMNLLNLAPDIQEEILFLGPVSQGRDSAWERRIRPFTSLVDWHLQRQMWDEMNHAPTIRRGAVGDSIRDRILVAGCLTPN